LQTNSLLSNQHFITFIFILGPILVFLSIYYLLYRWCNKTYVDALPIHDVDVTADGEYNITFICAGHHLVINSREVYNCFSIGQEVAVLVKISRVFPTKHITKISIKITVEHTAEIFYVSTPFRNVPITRKETKIISK